MELFSLVYYSRNRIDPASASLVNEVAQILAASVANNKARNVTGGLVYDGLWFAQVLEGERNDVLEIFERIKQDARHSDLHLSGSGPVGERRFAYWWMGGAAWDRDTADLFARRHGEDRFDPHNMSPDALADFIAAVIRLQVTRPIKPERSYDALASRLTHGMR